MMACEVFLEDVYEKLVACIHKASACVVQMFDHCLSGLKVEEPYDPSTYHYGWCCKVNLNDQTCNCEEFQVKKLPCAHVFIAYAKVFLDLSQFVDYIFWLDIIMRI